MTSANKEGKERSSKEKEEAEERKAIVEQLTACNAESDTLGVTLEAFKQRFINKEDLKAHTAINPKVSVVERQMTLPEHIHASFEEKLSNHNSETLVKKLSLFANHNSETLVVHAFKGHLTIKINLPA